VETTTIDVFYPKTTCLYVENISRRRQRKINVNMVSREDGEMEVESNKGK